MMLKVMFDTNVFNRILDGVVPVQALAGHVEVFATYIQLSAYPTSAIDAIAIRRCLNLVGDRGNA